MATDNLEKVTHPDGRTWLIPKGWCFYWSNAERALRFVDEIEGENPGLKVRDGVELKKVGDQREAYRHKSRDRVTALDLAHFLELKGLADVEPSGEASQAPPSTTQAPGGGEKPAAVLADMGAKAWDKIRIDFLDDDTIRVTVGAKSKRLNYTEAGFKGGRRALPNTRWEALRLMAEHPDEGLTGSRLPHGMSNTTNAACDIRKELRALFGVLPGDSLPFDKESRAYRPAFTLRDCREGSSPEEGDGAPSPSEIEIQDRFQEAQTRPARPKLYQEMDDPENDFQSARG